MKVDPGTGILDFHGRVAIITGAARGLGREYALLLASRGAAIVVNDLGGSRDGTGKSSAAADQVVREIVDSGGAAVADYHSVEDGELIVRTALDHFGRVDIVINNAGILRDKSMMKMTTEDFDLVHRVHLRGSFLVTKAAWPHLRQQNYGRIIMTASPSGIYGNFGQANYSSAKLALLALAKTLAVEGEKYNIKCNTIVPVAASRLTEDLLPEDILSLFRPSCVAPIVAFLCHETCPVSGEVFEAAGGYFGRYQWRRSRGKVFPKPDAITVEDIRDFWDEIIDMIGASCPDSMQNHTLQLMEQLQGRQSESSPDDQKNGAIVEPTNISDGEVCFVLTANDAILYALSVGVSTEEMSHLRYLYENDEEFNVFPTWATTISLNAIYETSLLSEAIERYRLQDNLIQTLHGEQYLKIYQRIPVPGKLYCQPKIVDVLDKGSGALIICEVPAYAADRKTLIFYSQLSFFMIGSGNFGGKRRLPAADQAKLVDCLDPPKRDPDYVMCQRTSLEQAALFRLCGDKNPLHIDSNFSVISGFKKPILHGLCVLGYAVRHVLNRYARYDGRHFDAVKARFVGSIVPGQTIETRTWFSDCQRRVHFECWAKETGAKLISSAFVDLKTTFSPEIMVAASSIRSDSYPGAAPDVQQANEEMEKCRVDKIFDGPLKQKVRANPDVVRKINTVYQFNMTKNGQPHTVWTLDLKNGNVYRGMASNPDCILSADDEVMADIFEEKDDPLEAYISGRLKITGNVMAAQKLRQLSDTNQNSNQSREDEDDRKLLESIPTSGVKSDLIFTILRNRMHEEPELIRRITAAYQFNITLNGKHAATWSTENRTNPLGAVYNQPYKNGKPDCLVTVEDDDLVKLMFGQLNPQRAFMLGKLKVKGNIMLLQRLNTIWFDLQKSGKAPEIPYIVELISKTDLMPGLRSEMMIIELIQRLIRLPYLCKEVNTLIGFEITKDDKVAAEYTLDFTKNQQTGVFDRGLPKGDQYCILTMSDDDFVRLTYHRFTLEQGIEMGKIKVRGDGSVIGKISIIFKTPTSRVKL